MIVTNIDTFVTVILTTMLNTDISKQLITTLFETLKPSRIKKSNCFLKLAYLLVLNISLKHPLKINDILR